MRLKLQYITSRFLAILMVVVLCALPTSCTDTETTDSTKFALHYAGITDIGPSMNFNLDGPTYIGNTPSDFAITRITVNGEVYSTDCFAIDSDKGSITIANTSDLPVGLYSLSISCYSSGKYYEFKDILTINMMKSVPDGITVEPNKIEVEYGDIIDEESTEILPTAQVKTDGNHISIRKYIIANVRKDGALIENKDFFAISATGEISVVKGQTGIQPGKYVLDLKLTTAVVDEEAEEGIFANALEIDITSKPLSLVYTPNSVRTEVGTGNVSVSPEFIGSVDDLVYSIKSKSPSTAPISIDPTTGVLTLDANNSLAIDDKCEVTVTATNKFGTADFENVYTINIVAFIHPIDNFSYNNTEDFIQATAFEHSVAVIDGDEVSYSFVNLPEELSALTIDSHSGKITATKGNSIPVGSHTVTVLAKNSKNEKQASFKLNVAKNPYYFTYIHWGNNLSLAPAKAYASQHRVNSKAELLALSIPVAETDLPNDVKVIWEVATESFSGGSTQIDEHGTLTFSRGWIDAKCFVVVVSATTGKGTAGEITVKTPVFVDCSAAIKGITVSYTPFAFQVNPRTGGNSVAPVITGAADRSQFLMDYRRTFNFYNINGPASHLDGQPTVKTSFMYSIWAAYFNAIGSSSVNTGARAPLSYYDNIGKTSIPAAFVNNTDLSVVVNPDKWKDDAGFANGVMIGQMTYATNGNPSSIGGGEKIFPLAIWFDTKF